MLQVLRNGDVTGVEQVIEHGHGRRGGKEGRRTGFGGCVQKFFTEQGIVHAVRGDGSAVGDGQEPIGRAVGTEHIRPDRGKLADTAAKAGVDLFERDLGQK